MDNTLFLPKQKNMVFNKSDLLLIYIYGKRTFYYFDKELPSEDNISNKEMKNNKVDEENKENILNNKLLRVLASNKVVQISPI